MNMHNTKYTSRSASPKPSPNPNKLPFSSDHSYWEKKAREDWYDNKGWQPIYQNELPPRHTLLREDRLPEKGDYGVVDESGNITSRIQAFRFVLMMMLYLQLDRFGYYDVLVVDVDCNFDLHLLYDAGIPLPRYFVSRRRQPGDAPTLVRRPHLVYWLRRPVPKSRNSQPSKAEVYYEAIRETLKARLTALGLDVDSKRPDLGKNPHHDTWDTVQGCYRDWDLGELHEALGKLEPASSKTPAKQIKSAQTEETKQKGGVDAPSRSCLSKAKNPKKHPSKEAWLDGCPSRNDYIFETTRLAAYPMKRVISDPIALYEWIHDFAHNLNRDRFSDYPKGPLEAKKVNSTVHSIFKFVEHKYTPSQDEKDRGVCRRKKLISAGMTKQMKQAVGGTYGARKNAERTRQLVLDARDALLASGQKATHSAIAREANVSRNTVRKWLGEITATGVKRPAQKVVNTVPIRKIHAIDTPTMGWIEAGGMSELHVTPRVVEIAALSTMQPEQLNSEYWSAANIPAKPVIMKKAWDLSVVYRYPGDSSRVLTSCGDQISSTDTRVANASLQSAPTSILDRAGYYDDPEDEYAPPIGEEDSNGVIWYPEEYFAAPDRTFKKQNSNAWTAMDVDQYLESCSA